MKTFVLAPWLRVSDERISGSGLQGFSICVFGHMLSLFFGGAVVRFFGLKTLRFRV